MSRSALARLGHETAMVSRVPDNALGDAAAGPSAALRRRRRGRRDRAGADGPLFPVAGRGRCAPSDIVYDREGSSFALAGPDDFDWDALLDGADLLHLSGITPALGRSARPKPRSRRPRRRGRRASPSRSTAITARSSGSAGTAIRGDPGRAGRQGRHPVRQSSRHLAAARPRFRRRRRGPAARGGRGGVRRPSRASS